MFQNANYKKTKDGQYKFITVDDVIQLIPAAIKRAQDDYGLILSEDEAICVMRHFKWDAERMSYSWFDD